MAYGFLKKMLTELTTAYNRDEDSNIGKLFQITDGVYERGYAAFEQIRDMRDIMKTTGITLDEVGRNWGVRRDGLDDDLYRLIILTKIISLLNGGDIDTVINAAAIIFQIDPSEIILYEVFPAKIRLDVPEKVLEAVGDMGRLEIVVAFIKRILAAGIWMDFVLYSREQTQAGLFVGGVMEDISSFAIQPVWNEYEGDLSETLYIGGAVGDISHLRIEAYLPSGGGKSITTSYCGMALGEAITKQLKLRGRKHWRIFKEQSSQN